MYLYLFLHRIGYKAYRDEKEDSTTKVRHNKEYSLILFAFSLGILGLSVEGFVLHSFVDRMIVYPFMALFGITYALYLTSSNKTDILTQKQKKKARLPDGQGEALTRHKK
jgi:hypothetical protein